MSSNIFRIFGIFLLALLVYAVINKFTTAKQPVSGAAMTFLTAVTNHDRAALERVLDTSVATPAYAGDKITGIHFNEIHVFEGAFSKTPDVRYTYLELAALRIPPEVRAIMTEDGKLATVQLADGGQIYLRLMNGQWKVIYISRPQELPNAEDA